MKTINATIIISTLVFLAAFATKKNSNLPFEVIEPTVIPFQQQYPGNADTGYWYLIEGDYLKSGIPYSLFKRSGISEKENYLGRHSDAATIPYNYNLIKAPNGEQIVAPNCLFCHAQKMGDSLIIGLGNSFSDYTSSQEGTMKMTEMALKMIGTEKERDAANSLIRAAKFADPYLTTACKGVNVADRLTSVLVAHRDPTNFKWIEKDQIKIPDELIPTDVPAWWLLKKKNGMFYNGFGRGDFTRFLMAANLLTVSDTSESAEVLTHFNNVLGYIYSIQPPKYPKFIDDGLANQGKELFNNSCSGCHGTYGEKAFYPNYLIPISTIRTDNALVNSNFSNPAFLEWFNKSWFTSGNRPAHLVPYNGYIAPPLDGVWATAPYLHNGSVPNLELLLNSKMRPKFWERNFDHPAYDFANVGWVYEEKQAQDNKSTYNTTIKGYGNGGHTFGDHFTNAERKEVIEYLKTL